MYFLAAKTVYEVYTPIEPNTIQDSKFHVSVFLCTHMHTHKVGWLTREF